MVKKFIKYIFVVLGVLIGVAVSLFILSLNNNLGIVNLGTTKSAASVGIIILFVISFGILFYFISPSLIKISYKITNSFETELLKLSSIQMVSGSVGLIIGLLIAYFISNIFSIIPIPILGVILTIITYLFLGYLGATVSTRKFDDASTIRELFKKVSSKDSEIENGADSKILDTSVIIDGRILDILKTGFIEGDIVIPEFILKELRHIADSSDGLKRTKGRRGLDILRAIQENPSIKVKIVNIDFKDVEEVDIKLLKLAQKMNAAIVTNDFNLNKVADIQGVKVLNINELSNAVKPNAIPGEEMEIVVIKEGKENNQGIAYLDDGTMIVVEDGKKLIGKTLQVTVTSILQTPAGRMIFVKPIN